MLGTTVEDVVDEMEAAEADVEVDVVATAVDAREILVGKRDDPKNEMLHAHGYWKVPAQRHKLSGDTAHSSSPTARQVCLMIDTCNQIGHTML